MLCNHISYLPSLCRLALCFAAVRKKVLKIVDLKFSDCFLALYSPIMSAYCAYADKYILQILCVPVPTVMQYFDTFGTGMLHL